MLGISVDATSCVLVAAGLDGSINQERQLNAPTPSTYSALLGTIETLFRQLLRPEVATVSIGLSLPGLIRRRAGISVFSPNLHLTDGRTPVLDLQASLGINCTLIQETHSRSQSGCTTRLSRLTTS